MDGNRQHAELIRDAVRTMQTRYQLFPSPLSAVDEALSDQVTVVIGVSGGADSICLLHLLVQLAAEWQLDLHVGHLDHALRPESVADAHFVEHLAHTWGIPFHCQCLAPGLLTGAGESLETAARYARHRYLAELAVEFTPAGQVPIIALAHHADDQAETVLHHLVRGSGLHGLAGMRPVSPLSPRSTLAESNWPVIHFVRPLLYVRRATILQYLQTNDLEWREDSTNTDQHYTRNYLRHTIMPALTKINPAAVEAIGRLATLAEEEAVRLDGYDQQVLRTLQLSNEDEQHERIVLDLDALRLLDHPTQRALLRLAVRTLAPTIGDVTFAHLDALCEQLQSALSGGPYPLLANVMWSVTGAVSSEPASLSIHRADALPFRPDQPLLTVDQQIALPAIAIGEEVHLTLATNWRLTMSRILRKDLPSDWQSRDHPWRAFFDVTILCRPILKTAVAGQQFAPLGMRGRHKALGDFFTDHKIPPSLRNRWPLLVDDDNDGVLWVCGLQMGHQARVTDQTTQILSIVIDQLPAASSIRHPEPALPTE